jgi:hypothetical protein
LRETDEDFELEPAFNVPYGSSLHLPVFHDDHFYLIRGSGMGMGRGRRGGGRGASGQVVCMDLDGNEMWASETSEGQPGYGTGNLLLAAEKLYIQDGHSGALRVVAANPDGYELLAEADLFGGRDARNDLQAWAPMALSQGRLLIRSQENLKCVDLRSGATEQ